MWFCYAFNLTFSALGTGYIIVSFLTSFMMKNSKKFKIPDLIKSLILSSTQSALPLSYRNSKTISPKWKSPFFPVPFRGTARTWVRHAVNQKSSAESSLAPPVNRRRPLAGVDLAHKKFKVSETQLKLFFTQPTQDTEDTKHTPHPTQPSTQGRAHKIGINTHVQHTAVADDGVFKAMGVSPEKGAAEKRGMANRGSCSISKVD